jgi:colicin import membrane protein
MAERRDDRWISIALSLLFHAALVGLIAYGWWTFRDKTPPPPRTLAIEATVVDAHDLAAAAPTPAAPVKPPPAPPPEPEPEPTGPPAPTAEELAQRAKAEQDTAERAQREVEEKRVAEADAARQAQEKRDAEEAAAKHQAAEEKRQLDAKRRAEEKRQAEEKLKVEEKRKAEEARLRALRESELQRSLAAEEHVMAARSNGQLASWEAQIQARIQRAWLRPPSARAGINCIVYVTQVPGGEVVNVRLGECNGDAAVRESIQAAAFRASPLPPPPDPALFERNLEIQFKPVD